MFSDINANQPLLQQSRLLTTENDWRQFITNCTHPYQFFTFFEYSRNENADLLDSDICSLTDLIWTLWFCSGSCNRLKCPNSFLERLASHKQTHTFSFFCDVVKNWSTIFTLEDDIAGNIYEFVVIIVLTLSAKTGTKSSIFYCIVCRRSGAVANSAEEVLRTNRRLQS